MQIRMDQGNSVFGNIGNVQQKRREVRGHLFRCIKQKVDKFPANKFANLRKPGSLTRRKRQFHWDSKAFSVRRCWFVCNQISTVMVEHSRTSIAQKLPSLERYCHGEHTTVVSPQGGADAEVGIGMWWAGFCLCRFSKLFEVADVLGKLFKFVKLFWSLEYTQTKSWG